MEPHDVAHAYDAWARTYDSDPNATRDLDAVVLRATAIELHGRDIVELGCGTGKNTVFLAGHVRSVVGLDFSAPTSWSPTSCSSTCSGSAAYSRRSLASCAPAASC